MLFYFSSLSCSRSAAALVVRLVKHKCRQSGLLLLIRGCVNVGSARRASKGGFPRATTGGGGRWPCPIEGPCSSTRHECLNHTYVVMMPMAVQPWLSCAAGFPFCDARSLFSRPTLKYTRRTSIAPALSFSYCSTYDRITPALCLLSPEENFHPD